MSEITDYITEQKQKTQKGFIKMSEKYIPKNRIDLWKSYVNAYYASDERIESMANIFKIITMLDSRIDIETIVSHFMHETLSLEQVRRRSAAIIAFFSKRGEEFYEALANLTRNDAKTRNIIDEEFAQKIHELNQTDDIEEALPLFDASSVYIKLENYKPFKTISYNDEYFKGNNGKYGLIGARFGNHHVYYILEKDGTYRRIILFSDLREQGKVPLGFVSDENNMTIAKLTDKFYIAKDEKAPTLEDMHQSDTLFNYLQDDSTLINIMRELNELGSPVNQEDENSTLTIKAIFYREMLDIKRLEKALGQ